MELRAGKITLEYENGSLRYLRTTSCEVVRMIYFTIRDKNWGTIPSRISNEIIKTAATGFDITYTCNFESAEIKMIWSVWIVGKENSEIQFVIKGKALSGFQKNRAGFCVLHPINECAGKAVIIAHPDGSTGGQTFPEYVSPHQPFTNIAGMTWEPSPSCRANLQFSGDVFEMEDHRNWSDNNFKTYCTPLSLPFPVSINTGDEIQQTIILKLQESGMPVARDTVTKISFDPSKIVSIPPIGISLTDASMNISPHELSALRKIGFRHCRIDIKLNNLNWTDLLKKANEVCAALNTKLELCLFVDDDTRNELTQLTGYFPDKSILGSVAILPLGKKCTDAATIELALASLRKDFPDALIGGGTDIYFTELNRSSMSAEKLDFVQYSVNPQVHTSDDYSLVENAGAQASVIPTAHKKFGKPVHISPITLRMRYNADATDNNKREIPAADPRQKTAFCAGWTLASAKYAIESGAASLTYFEATGDRGIVSLQDGRVQRFPVAELFQFFLQKKWKEVIISDSSFPLKISSLVLKSPGEICILLANHTSSEQDVILNSGARHTLSPYSFTRTFAAT